MFLQLQDDLRESKSKQLENEKVRRQSTHMHVALYVATYISVNTKYVQLRSNLDDLQITRSRAKPVGPATEKLVIGLLQLC